MIFTQRYRKLSNYHHSKDYNVFNQQTFHSLDLHLSVTNNTNKQK